jgi:hypothetical protein
MPCAPHPSLTSAAKRARKSRAGACDRVVVSDRVADKRRADKRAAATERKRNSRRRQKLLALGLEPTLLWLPREVRLGWEARERVSSCDAPLAVDQYETDLADILVEWAHRWATHVTR